MNSRTDLLAYLKLLCCSQTSHIERGAAIVDPHGKCKSASLLCWISSGLILTSTAWGAADPPTLNVLGAWPAYTNAYTAHSQVVGQIAYVAVGNEGLLIADISDPANPKRLGNCRLGSHARYVCVDNGQAYVATRTGLQIVDVRDPALPGVLGTYATVDDCTAVDMYGNTAFLSGYGGVQVIDIRQPAMPRHLSTYRSGEAKSVRLFGQHAFVRTRTAIDVVDLSNLSQPRLANRLDFDSSTPTGIQIWEDKLVACFVGKMAGLYIFGLQDAAKPILVGRAYTGSVIPFGGRTGTHPTSLSVSSGLAYVTTDNLKLMAFSITNTALPVLVAEHPALPSSATLNDISTSGDQVYVAAGPLGLQIFSSLQAGFKRLGGLETAWDFRGIVVADNLAFVVDYVNGFQIIDVSTPSRPERLGLLPMDFDGSRFSLRENMALVANGTNGISYVDFSKPANPQLVETVTFDVPVRDIQEIGNRAYVACDVGGIAILSMLDPLAPTLLGFYNTPRSALRLAVLDGFAYVADGFGGLQVLDVSDPGLPGRVKELPLGNVHAVTVANKKAYLGINGTAIACYDLSTPAAPAFLQTMSAFSNARVFDVATSADGVTAVYDRGVASFVAPGSAPTAVYEAPNSRAVCVSKSRVYLAGEYGLKILGNGLTLPSSLRISWDSPGFIRVSWDGPGSLETAPSLNGPWAEVPSAKSPVFMSTAAKQQFFRIK